MNNYPGKLIVLYGINNLGKSTQAKLLVEKLKSEGHQAEYLKYPIYDLSPSGEILNDYLRQGNFYDLSPKEAQIIYALNRTQYQERLIEKLKSGIHVIAEDYKGTGIAWGLGAGISETFLKSINSHLIDEDLVFLFDGERFLEAMEKTHKHETNSDLTNKVRWAHLKLREEYNWIKINANLSIEEIAETIWDKVDKYIKNGDKPKVNNGNKYNYSGFDTLGDILNGKHGHIMEKLNQEPENNIPDNIKDEKKEEKKEDLVYNNKEVIVELFSPDASLPKKAHDGDAGYDLFADDYYTICPYGQALVKTGIKMMIPGGYVGLIWDKSGLASQGITTMGGVIDSNYRGEIKVVVKNLSEDDFNIVPGQKIAQILIQEIPETELKQGKVINDSKRGENNFGSSGKF